MKRLIICLVLLTVGLAAASGGTAPAAPPGMVNVIVTLEEQEDLKGISGSRAARLNQVIQRLQAKANATQIFLRALIATKRAQGVVSDVRYFWIFNGFALRARADFVNELAARQEIFSVTPDETITSPPPISAQAAPEANLSQIGAPGVWAAGYRGTGIVVASMDTGVDDSHPDLSTQWRGGTNSWFDPSGQHPTDPTDVNGHGTATIGLMVGREAGGTAIGVAPDATWIAVKIFNDQGAATTSGIHQGFQWLLDPDGNPATADAPHVVNNSWGSSSPGCDLSFQLDLQNLRAAGILPVFSAGNAGPVASSSVSPANNPEAFAVGAVDSSDAIYSSSSRGPSACGETSTTFPELVAPGVGVRSADLFGTYASRTGTSAAAPHAAGALALLLDVDPTLTVADQEALLENSAVDLGEAGPDNTFGEGRLDVLAAYNALTAPDFGLTASPASASTNRPGGVSYTINVAAENGFAGTVSFSVSGLPAAATHTFTPDTVTGSGSTQLDVTVSGSTPTGSFPLTITGTSGSLSHTATVTLVVTSPGPPKTAFPKTVTILPQGGTHSGGSVANLKADDSSYYYVDAYWPPSGNPKTTFWRGNFTAIPTALASLKVTYLGKNSRTCTQTLRIWNFATSTWQDLDTRTVGNSDVLIADKTPPGALGDYVSAAGDVRVGVHCTRTASTGFYARGDLMKIVYVP